MELGLNSCLVWQLWDEALVLQQLQDDAVPEAEARAWLRLAAERRQQPVIAPAPKDCPQLPGSIPPLKYNTCNVSTAMLMRSKEALLPYVITWSNLPVLPHSAAAGCRGPQGRHGGQG